MRPRKFAVDFDGTLVVGNNYPYIGEPNWPIVEKVKKLKKQGHEISLWTCRQGEHLQEAVDFCKDKLGLEFDYINSNTYAMKYNFKPIKIVADYYIDDRALSLNEFLEKENFDD